MEDIVKHDNVKRCGWVTADPIYLDYHDHEWGVEITDDQMLFEHLCLEVNQAGLSWLTVLKKRENYRALFHEFEVNRVAKMRPATVNKLLKDARIIRNRAKIEAMIHNASRFLEVQDEFGSFYEYSQGFLPKGRIVNKYKALKQVPAKTAASETMSKDLKKRGFKFVGPTTIYAHMQAVGMVNDHLTTCFRYKSV